MREDSPAVDNNRRIRRRIYCRLILELERPIHDEIGDVMARVADIGPTTRWILAIGTILIPRITRWESEGMTRQVYDSIVGNC